MYFLCLIEWLVVKLIALSCLTVKMVGFVTRHDWIYVETVCFHRHVCSFLAAFSEKTENGLV